jgi:hypothetical protein
MKNLVGIFLVVFVMPFEARTAFEPKTTSARAMGLGNAFVAYPGDVWGVFINPAGWANLHQMTAGVFYSRLFGLPEFALLNDVFATPTSWGVLGGAIESYGFDLYRENVFSLTFANTYFEKLRIGVNAKILSLEIQNYGSNRVIAFDLGIQTSLFDDLCWGFSVINLNAPSFGKKAPDRVAQVFSTGILYQSAAHFRILADLVKDVRFSLNGKLGLEYQPVSFFIVRAGLNTDPSLFSAGVGFQFRRFEVDYGFSSHNDLGETHAVSILFLLSSGTGGGKKGN